MSAAVESQNVCAEGAVPTAEAGASEPGDQQTGRIERVQAMEALLVYRAVLVAAILSTGMDTSDLLQLKNRNQIVQVL